jgi:tetratricopeptide (TPR) repeat protein
MKHLTSFWALLLAILFAGCTPSDEELIDQSRSLLDAGQYEQAIQLLNRTLEHYPEQTTAYNMRGVAKVELQQYDAALADFSQAIRLDSTSYRPYYNRANVYFQVNRYPEALDDYNQVVRLAPEQTDVYVNRAATLYEMEQYENARLDLEAARQQAPDRPLIHYNLAKTLYMLNETELAKEALNRVVTLDNSHAGAFYLMGVIARDAGSTEEACTYFAQADKLGNEEAHAAADALCDTGHNH